MKNAGEKRRETYDQVVLQLKHEENGEDSDWGFAFASTMTYGNQEALRAIRTAADPYICWHLLLSQRAAAVAYSTNALSLVDRPLARSRNSPNHGERWTRCAPSICTIYSG